MAPTLLTTVGRMTTSWDLLSLSPFRGRIFRSLSHFHGKSHPEGWHRGVSGLSDKTEASPPSLVGATPTVVSTESFPFHLNGVVAERKEHRWVSSMGRRGPTNSGRNHRRLLPPHPTRKPGPLHRPAAANGLRSRADMTSLIVLNYGSFPSVRRPIRDATAFDIIRIYPALALNPGLSKASSSRNDSSRTGEKAVEEELLRRNGDGLDTCPRHVHPSKLRHDMGELLALPCKLASG